MSTIYSDEMIESFRVVMRDIELAKSLRRFYPPQMLFYRNSYLETSLPHKCHACNKVLKAKFGDYSKPLAEQWMPCPNGKPEEKHGYWASVVNINLN